MKQLTICLLLVLSAATLRADLVVAPDSSWIGLNNPGVGATTALREQLVQNGNPTTRYQAYWNNNTLDSSDKCANVGCYLTSQSYFSGNADLGLDNGVWLGKKDSPTGEAVTNFSFNGQTSGETRILIELAGMARKNWFGWYAPDQVGGGFTEANFNTAWGILFDGNDAAGGTGVNGVKGQVDFKPNGNFGFWFLPNFTDVDFDTNNSNPDQYIRAAAGRLSGTATTTNSVFTESSRNKGYTPDKQYFALFAASQAAVDNPPTDFWMGIEDLKAGDNDFNDMVVKFKLESFVPEPGFYGVLALGLGALLMARSRRQ